jgi:hypothetical protein
VPLVFKSSLNFGRVKDTEDGTPKHGVQLVSLREKLASRLYKRCVWRKLNVKRTPDMLQAPAWIALAQNSLTKQVLLVDQVKPLQALEIMRA